MTDLEITIFRGERKRVLGEFVFGNFWESLILTFWVFRKSIKSEMALFKLYRNSKNYRIIIPF